MLRLGWNFLWFFLNPVQGDFGESQQNRYTGGIVADFLKCGAAGEGFLDEYGAAIFRYKQDSVLVNRYFPIQHLSDKASRGIGKDAFDIRNRFCPGYFVLEALPHGISGIEGSRPVKHIYILAALSLEKS